MNGAIYVGQVTHRRTAPFGHSMRYRTYSLLVDIDEIESTARQTAVLSHNRWNLFSIHDRDFGPRDGTSLRTWIDSQLGSAGIDLDGGSVRLLFFPRLLGYAFNPLTIWFCHHKDGTLRAVLYEVHNTFGQSHSHLVPVDGAGGEPLRHEFAKQLHVSPFFDQDGSYAFTLRPPADRFSVSIAYAGSEGQLLRATIVGDRRPLRSSSLLRVFATHPLLTFKVIVGIHWHALRLWKKGARYRAVPEAPVPSVRVEATVGTG